MKIIKIMVLFVTVFITPILSYADSIGSDLEYFLNNHVASGYYDQNGARLIPMWNQDFNLFLVNPNDVQNGQIMTLMDHVQILTNKNTIIVDRIENANVVISFAENVKQEIQKELYKHYRSNFYNDNEFLNEINKISNAVCYIKSSGSDGEIKRVMAVINNKIRISGISKCISMAVMVSFGFGENSNSNSRSVLSNIDYIYPTPVDIEAVKLLYSNEYSGSSIVDDIIKSIKNTNK